MRARTNIRNPRYFPVLSALGIACALSAMARESAAEEGKRTSSLAWVRLEGAESCVAGATLARSVEDRLRRKVFVSASDADISVEGSIGPAPKPQTGFHAVLRVTSRDGAVLGSREVDTRSSHCDAIDEKLALIVSVLIDPDAGGEEDPPPTALAPPPAVAEHERVVVVHDHDAPSPAPAPEEPWRLATTVGAAGLFGLQPDVGFGVSPSFYVRPPHFWGILIGGTFSGTTTTTPVQGATADASFASGLIALCPFETTSGRINAHACAGALVGALHSRGENFDMSTSTSSLVAGPVITGRVSLDLVGPLIAYLGAELLVPISHAEVGYRTPAGEGTLFRTAAVAGMGELGVGVKFP